MISIYSLNCAQPLPSLVGEGWGWGRYLSLRQDITDPTPAPPLEGRGKATGRRPQVGNAAARCFFNL